MPKHPLLPPPPPTRRGDPGGRPFPTSDPSFPRQWESIPPLPKFPLPFSTNMSFRAQRSRVKESCCRSTPFFPHPHQPVGATLVVARSPLATRHSHDGGNPSPRCRNSPPLLYQHIISSGAQRSQGISHPGIPHHPQPPFPPPTGRPSRTHFPLQLPSPHCRNSPSPATLPKRTHAP